MGSNPTPAVQQRAGVATAAPSGLGAIDLGTLGGTSSTACAVRGQIESTSPDQQLIVVATGQYLGEGFDCPQLDTLFLAFPVSFKGRLVQYTGRLMRASEGKTSVRVYDYADVRVPVLRSMHARRLTTYKSLGFDQHRQQTAFALATGG